MNTERPRYASLFQRNLFLGISVFTALVIFALVPLFKTTASSPSSVRLTKGATMKAPIVGSVRSLLSLLQGPSETIATYSSDCSTPQSTFQLGETVCAKTNSVDLNYAGGRWVHWLAPGDVVEYGSSTATLITANPQTFLHTPAVAGAYKATIAETGDISETPAVFTVVASTSLATYAAGCTAASSTFTLGDSICVQAAEQPSDPDRVVRRIQLVNPDGYLVDTFDIPAGSLTASHTFTLPEDSHSPFPGNPPVAVDNRGSWRVNVVDTGDASIKESLPVTVRDPVISVSDLHISKVYADTNVAEAGSTLSAVIWVFNGGPDPAQNVAFTDVTPANTTFQSLEHTFGPGFTCTLPAVGSAGTISCSRTSLGKDEASGFLVTYTIENSVAGGTEFTSEATVTTTTTDREATDNSSESTGTVGTGSTGGCTLACPDNVAAAANTVEDVGGVPTSGARVSFSAAEANGDCGTVSSSHPSGSFFPVGNTVVTVNSTGGSCSFTVSVAAVAIDCPVDVFTTAEADETTADVDPGTPTTTPSSGVTVVGIRSDDDNDSETPPLSLTAPYSIGATVIDWTVTDAGGHTARCQQRIFVNAPDRQILTISCPANQTVVAPSGSCTATVTTGTPTTTPSDSDVTVQGTRSDGESLSDPYPAGVTSITWTATDAVNGNVASCTQSITVTTTGDTTAPTFTSVPPPVTVTTNSCGQIVGETALGTPEATDTDNNCATGTVNIARSGVPAGNFFPTGTTTITYTATDAAGNSTTATQTVTVQESPAINPTITAPPDPAPTYTGPGSTSCGALVSDATLGSASGSDNCPGMTITRTGVPAGNIFPVGSTTVTYTATDRSGNTASDTQVVVVHDNTPPALSCPSDITVYLPLNSTATSMAVTYPAATAPDNCGGATVGYSQASGSIFPMGTTEITVTATDANNNSAECSFNVTVLYNFAGFFSPIDNLPTINSMKAGQAAPVKFSLSGNKGLNIFASNSPSSVQVGCQSGVPVSNVEDTFNAGSSSLSYNATSDQYNYVWKTESSWKNTCRLLTVTLNDGSQHSATFTFK
jgi:uncharacterized repeat protein (TIGR01451 family)